MKESIADRLKAELSRGGWSTREFQLAVERAARELGEPLVGQAHVWATVSGEGEPHTGFLRAAAQVFGVRLQYLQHGESPRTEQEVELASEADRIREELNAVLTRAFGNIPVSPETRTVFLFAVELIQDGQPYREGELLPDYAEFAEALVAPFKTLGLEPEKLGLRGLTSS